MLNEAQARMIEELREAFASGRSAAGEELLARALEAGLPWDVVTRAVADGVTRRYDPRRRPEDLVERSVMLA